MWVIPPVAGLIEPTPAPVIWIDDIGAIALSDGIASIYYCACRPDLHGGEVQRTVELIVQHRLISVIEELPKMFVLAQRLIGGSVSPREPNPPPASRPRLVT